MHQYVSTEAHTMSFEAASALSTSEILADASIWRGLSNESSATDNELELPPDARGVANPMPLFGAFGSAAV